MRNPISVKYLPSLVLFLLFISILGILGFFLKEVGVLLVPSAQKAQSIAITTRGANAYVEWENLPSNTKEIIIYKYEEGSDTPIEWKRISIPGGTTEGSAYLGLRSEIGGAELYTFEVVLEDPPPPPPPDDSDDDNTTPPPGDEQQPPPPPPPPPVDDEDDPPPPDDDPPVDDEGDDDQGDDGDDGDDSEDEETYYTPEGDVSGTGDPGPTQSFWVQHVNKRIEIGWQNIEAATNVVVVYRSDSIGDKGSQLLRQENPIVDYYFIRLVDNTLHAPKYYTLETWQDDALLNTYGPELLDPLE